MRVSLRIFKRRADEKGKEQAHLALLRQHEITAVVEQVLESLALADDCAKSDKFDWSANASEL